MNPNYP